MSCIHCEKKFLPFANYKGEPIVELYKCSQCGAERYRVMSTKWISDEHRGTSTQLGSREDEI